MSTEVDPQTDPTCTMWCPATVFSFSARQRVTEWKGQTCGSPTNSTPTGDSTLKVEQRVKDLIILQLN